MAAFFVSIGTVLQSKVQLIDVLVVLILCCELVLMPST
jgi:hypothetical protein